MPQVTKMNDSLSIPHIPKQIFILLKRELLLEIRSKEQITVMIIFALTSILIFQFSFELRTGNVQIFLPGILWIAMLFASSLSIDRSMTRDSQTGVIQGMLFTPVDPISIFISKVLANTLFLLALNLILLPTISILLNTNLPTYQLLPVIVLGAIGLSATGTIVSASLTNMKSRASLLPIILFPLLFPVVLSSTTASGMIIDGYSWDEYSKWIGVLLSYDIIFIVTSSLIFSYAVEA